jgi:hypothetical protein
MDIAKVDVEDYLHQVLPEAEIKSLKDVMQSESLLFNAQVLTSLKLDGTNIEFKLYSLKSSSGAALGDIQKMIAAKKVQDIPAVYLVSYASPEKRKNLKSLGLNFMDTAGNAWIKLPGLYVDKQGNKLQKRKGDRAAVRNVFSDKASLVLRLLLQSGKLGIREISRTLEADGFLLSPGYVSKIVRSLTDQHFVRHTENSFALSDPKALLDDWVYDYRRRNKATSLGFYYPSTNLREMMTVISMSLENGYAFSGLAGASLVDSYAQFDAVDVFAGNLASAENALVALGAKQVDRGANINLIKPYYTVSAFYGVRDISGKQVASDLQLYLDLLCQPIRGTEAAEHLYGRRLAKTLNLLDGD